MSEQQTGGKNMGEQHADNGVKPQAAQSKPVEQQQPPAMQSAALVRFEPQTATEAWQLAKYYGASNLLPSALKSVGDVFVTIMAGRDFGWSPMQALRGIYVVEGKPSLSADAMVSIVKASGKADYFRLVKSDTTEAVYETKRKGDPEPVRMGFTIGEAEAAGLLAKKGPWHTYRARMLRNRAKSILCKEVYEDLFLGTYEEDEGREVAEIRGLEQRPTPTERDATPAAVRVETIRAAQATVETPANTTTAPQAEERNPDELCEELRQAMMAAQTTDALKEIAAKVKVAYEDGRQIGKEHREKLLAVFGQRSKDLVPAVTQ